MANDETLVVNELYSNADISRILGVGNSGGVRLKKSKHGGVQRLVLCTSVKSARQLAENPYQDRLEGDMLTYTGMGRAGDQSITSTNARLIQQQDDPFPIYCFMKMASRRDPKVGAQRWAFLGLLQYIRCYSERQIDNKGAWRKVWVFELRLHTNPDVMHLRTERETMLEILASRPLELVPDDREVVGAGENSEERKVVELATLEPIRNRLLGYEPRQFEHVICDLLVQSGFNQVEVTKYSQDGGVDVNARPGGRSWPLRHLLVQVQAKRWLHSVGRKEVAELRGSLQPHAAGCIVTTSHFSRAALAEAIDPGKSPITTIDGYELASIIDTLRLQLA